MKLQLTPQEYLEQERAASFKSEYLAGHSYTMAGASESHNLITANLTRELSLHLKGRPCKTYASDLKVQVSATGLYSYPDVLVVCGPAQFADAKRDVLLNPTLIIEVLSPTTEAYDRGEKFSHYRHLASLTDYLLVAQDRILVEHYLRQPQGKWLLTTVEDRQGTLRLETLQGDFLLAEIYDKVEFSPGNP